MGEQASHDENGEAAIDPAMEHLRRKLVRFMAVNLGLLGLALMAVLAVIVYRSMTPSPEMASPARGERMTGEIVLPAGARIVAHALSGDRISLDAELADGSRIVVVYDMVQGRTVGRFTITAE
jgi:hypothetical protein